MVCIADKLQQSDLLFWPHQSFYAPHLQFVLLCSKFLCKNIARAFRGMKDQYAL